MSSTTTEPASAGLAPDLRDRLSRRLASSPALGWLQPILADTAVAFALATNFDGKMGFATADLTIHFLQRAKGDVLARARILKKGRRVNVGEVSMTDSSGREVARAVTTFLLTTSSFDYAPEGKP